jgi:pimeloyl-ACP methyl ester carboxylesterase
MPVISVNNRQVHIQELNKGAKETILLIHGMFSNLSVYYFNIAPILAQHFHVVMYDLKGHGISEKAKTGYDLHSMTDDVLGLLNELGLTAVHLAGYSYGGLIALKMATRFPDKVKKVVLIEAPDPSDDKARGIIDDYSKEFLEHYIENFTDTTKVKMGKRQLERNHRMYEYLFYETSLKADMLIENNFFESAEIDMVSNETILMYGTDSNCLEAGKKLKKRIKRAELLKVEGDHNIPIQQPGVVGNIMESFFKKRAVTAL